VNDLIKKLARGALLLMAACHAESLDVVPDVDLARFQGKWYEVAKLPRATESGCTGTTAFYRLKSDSEIDVVNECRLGDLTGPVRTVSANARVTDPGARAKLSIDFGGFYGDYWIIDLGERYEFAVIGHPTRDYLWILSRTPTLDAAKLADILGRARAKKFDVSRLEYTKQ
jgi:apolipoprotein D and lipocalin family protein